MLASEHGAAVEITQATYAGPFSKISLYEAPLYFRPIQFIVAPEILSRDAVITVLCSNHNFFFRSLSFSSWAFL